MENFKISFVNFVVHIRNKISGCISICESAFYCVYFKKFYLDIALGTSFSVYFVHIIIELLYAHHVAVVGYGNALHAVGNGHQRVFFLGREGSGGFENADILHKLMGKYTFENVDNSWIKMCYYYDYLGPNG